jgi:hypothetical protein
VVEAHLHFAGVRVDAGVGIRVAGVPQDLARDAFGAGADVAEDRRVGGAEFAGDDDQIIGDQGFAGHLGGRLAGEEGVEDGIRDLVGELVGMALGDRLGGEQVFAHQNRITCRTASPESSRSKPSLIWSSVKRWVISLSTGRRPALNNSM